MKRVAILMFVLCSALLGLLGWHIHLQKLAEAGSPSGSGVVEAQGVDVSSRVAARLARLPVQEGQRVARGDVLMQLACEDLEARSAEAEARLSAARAQVGSVKAQAAASRSASAAAQAAVGALVAQLDALTVQEGLAVREAERMEAMGEHAAVAARDQARSSATNLREQRAGARSSVTASRRQATSAAAQARAADAEVAAADRNVGALEAAARHARLALDECTIRAPRDGVLERLYYEPGELVSSGSPVARLLDPSVAELTFYLASADLGAARVGMTASVVADAYPREVFEAEVTRIGLAAEFTPRNVQTRSDRDRLVYPVEVRVRRHRGLLRDGMHAVITLNARDGIAVERLSDRSEP